MCHVVSGWCMMWCSTRKEGMNHDVNDCHVPPCEEASPLLLSLSRCISGCQMYLRSDHFKAADCILEIHTNAHTHTQTHTHADTDRDTQRRFRIFSYCSFLRFWPTRQFFGEKKKKKIVFIFLSFFLSFVFSSLWGHCLALRSFFSSCLFSFLHTHTREKTMKKKFLLTARSQVTVNTTLYSL